jgi:peptide chain release factor 3
MDIECARSGRAVGTKYVTTAFGNDRETIEEAFPGDIIGLVNAGDLRIGDTIYAGKKVEFPGVPRFAPEVFASARPLDRSKIKQFRKGIEQLDQEGVVQVLRDLDFGDTGTKKVLHNINTFIRIITALSSSSPISSPNCCHRK